MIHQNDRLDEANRTMHKKSFFCPKVFQKVLSWRKKLKLFFAFFEVLEYSESIYAKNRFFSVIAIKKINSSKNLKKMVVSKLPQPIFFEMFLP